MLCNFKTTIKLIYELYLPKISHFGGILFDADQILETVWVFDKNAIFIDT